METRGATGVYDKANDTRSTPARRAPTVGAQAAAIMGVNEVARHHDDVGGAFGMKTPVYPEYPALLIAACQLGRPCSHDAFGSVRH
jgi:carbon-monoxide dehydrogenase large subunit